MPTRSTELRAQPPSPNACIPQPKRDGLFVRVQNAMQSSFDEGAQGCFLLGRVSPCSVDEIVGKFSGRLHYGFPYRVQRVATLP